MYRDCSVYALAVLRVDYLDTWAEGREAIRRYLSRGPEEASLRIIDTGKSIARGFRICVDSLVSPAKLFGSFAFY